MVARDTVNLPAVALAFDSLVPSEFVGGWSPTAQNGRRECRPLKSFWANNPVLFCHSLCLHCAGYMECSDPELGADPVAFDRGRHPTAKNNVFVHVKREMPLSVTNDPAEVNDNGKHRKVRRPQSMQMGAFERIIMSHAN